MKKINKYSIVLTGLLLSCDQVNSDDNNSDSLSSSNQQYLTRAEVNAVADLSQIGEIGFINGQLAFGGKIVKDPAIIAEKTYGRKYNLLNLSEEVLNSVDITTRDLLIFGSMEDIKTVMNYWGVKDEDIDFNRPENPVSLEEFRSLVKEEYNDLSQFNPLSFPNSILLSE